jgi:hypothetical protein
MNEINLPTLDPRRTIPEKSAGRQLLEDRFHRCQIGEIVSYTEIEAIIRANPRFGAGRAMIYGAIKSLSSGDLAYRFDCVRHVGYKRLNDSGIAKGTGYRTKKIHRQAGRTVKFGMAGNTMNMQPLERTSFLGSMAIAQAAVLATSRKARNFVESQTADPTKKISSTEFLEYLARKKE